jgi:uncharacterized protein (DUF1697 family)
MGSSIYVSLLRGINVSGQKIIKMERLRDVFESGGFQDVKTYVQSGNVLFRAPTKDPVKLAARIHSMINDEFGFSVSVLVRSAAELNKVAKANPFLRDAKVEVSRLYVSFLSETPAKAALKKLESLAATPERFHCVSRELYLSLPNGYGRTKLNNNVIEKALSVVATTRNWNTVTRLCELALD